MYVEHLVTLAKVQLSTFGHFFPLAQAEKVLMQITDKLRDQNAPTPRSHLSLRHCYLGYDLWLILSASKE
jgi:hypothetical protein